MLLQHLDHLPLTHTLTLTLTIHHLHLLELLIPPFFFAASYSSHPPLPLASHQQLAELIDFVKGLSTTLHSSLDHLHKKVDNKIVDLNERVDRIANFVFVIGTKFRGFTSEVKQARGLVTTLSNVCKIKWTPLSMPTTTSYNHSGRNMRKENGSKKHESTNLTRRKQRMRKKPE
ncbi:hypothetical protein U1Q18_025271 [Sarracenia purpurea var. burkii]